MIEDSDYDKLLEIITPEKGSAWFNGHISVSRFKLQGNVLLFTNMPRQMAMGLAIKHNY